MATQTHMRWSTPRVIGGSTPTIKNHTATLVDNQLFIFGGYDGRRNHSTVHIFDFDTFTWRPCTNISGKAPQGRNGHTCELARGSEKAPRARARALSLSAFPPFVLTRGDIARRATLAERMIFIIGGWLGSGPLAASDMYVLHIDTMSWEEPPVEGQPPGPCNMHSADYIPHLRQVLVFRGGDGREYLNDLHALDIDTYRWEEVEVVGSAPLQRANHASAVFGVRLFIFGGWDGQKRLNDVHVLNTETMVWTEPRVGGTLPHPRAGMTFTRLRDHLFLFGGSGPSAKCFNDLQVLDPQKMEWIDTVRATNARSGGGDNMAGGDGNSQNAEGLPDADQVAVTLDTADADPPLAPVATTHEGTPAGVRLASINPQLSCSHAHPARPKADPSCERIVMLGDGPGRRAGHTATVVSRRLFVFGGSFGTDYLNDFFELDSDPPPEARVSSPSCLQLLHRGLGSFANSDEFADIKFIVQGRVVYGHRIVLSLLSDRFRAMFRTNLGGFREATQTEIAIHDYSHKVFVMMIEYLYSGQPPSLQVDPSLPGLELDLAVELLELSDEYMLDHLKQSIETLLQEVVREDTVEFLLHTSERTNAWQLGAVCRHFIRNGRAEIAGAPTLTPDTAALPVPTGAMECEFEEEGDGEAVDSGNPSEN